MVAGRPEPGAELTDGPEEAARPAAAAIVVRGGAEPLELLMVQRTPKARFMGGAWVFPGGSVDPSDGAGQAGLRAAARRELLEEAGVELATGAELVPFMRWITPARRRPRFDTWFFLTPAPAGAAPQVDGSEIVAFRWTSPRAALHAGATDELLLTFPTVKQLERLCAFASADELLARARGTRVTPVQPRIAGSGEQARILLPGEPGYEDAV